MAPSITRGVFVVYHPPFARGPVSHQPVHFSMVFSDFQAPAQHMIDFRRVEATL